LFKTDDGARRKVEGDAVRRVTEPIPAGLDRFNRQSSADEK
jgi:hypothetical protein